MKKVLLIVLCICLMTTPVLANSIVNTIDVIFDTVKVQVNNQDVDVENILYNGTTYLPMRKVVELVGKDIEWNQDTMTANIVEKNENSLDISLPTITSYGFENEAYIVNFSDGFTIGLDSKKNDVPGFPTYESVLVSAHIKNMNDSSIISTPIMVGFNELYGYKYNTIAYELYSEQIPEEYREGFKKFDFYENYNSKTYIDSFGGAVYFESNSNLDGVVYDDGVHKCVLYLNR